MPSGAPGTLRELTRPSMFLLHVPAVIAVVAAVLLGQWQINAWQMHREHRAAELADADPKPLEDVLGPDEPFPGAALGQPVVVAGEWVPGSTVYVADRVHEGTTGFWTVTALSTCGSAAAGCEKPAAMPVVLGWTPTVDQAPAEPTGTAEVTGWLQPGEGPGDADPDPADAVLPTLRIADLIQRFDQDLYGAYTILETPADARATLEPVTPESLPEAPTTTALRNLLYGIEWWFFAGFAVFLWWRWTRDELAAARVREESVNPVSVAAEPDQEDEPARIPSEP